MWLFTPRGFYSVVEKPEDRGRGTLTVRARVKADLDRLKDLIPDAKPYRIKYSDYPWRVNVTREQWEAAMVALCDEITYANFKDEVKRVQGAERASRYSRVWSVLYGLTPQPRRRRSRITGFTDEELNRWRAGL